MDTQSLSTQMLLELTKTETNKEFQTAIVRELVSRGLQQLLHQQTTNTPLEER